MTRRPTSCSSAATASSSRSTQPTTRPIWSAARWVARAWTRKRSGFSSQPPLDSKKSKLGAVPAIASTPEGLSTSIASGMLPTPPATTPLRLAKRRTEIERATSDSTASTRSPTRAVSAVAAAITRSRDSIRTGKRSTASKASARRLPGAAAPREPLPLRPLRRASARCAATLPLVWRLVGGAPLASTSADEDVWFSRKYPCSGALSSIYPSSFRDREARQRPLPACFRVSSRPSAASDSKMPGETELPVIATRIGW